MKQRYDTAANWTAQNPTLLAGEIGIESDTKKWKVGTGSTAWTSLVYAIGGTYPIVNADIAAAAAIAYSKLATLTSGNIVLGSAANVATSTAVTGDVTISSTGVTAIAAGVIVNADINASAGIVDTKLATIATAGKVSNSATTATNANTASAIVARDASGNFSAGTITASLTGNASTVTTNANLTGDVTSVGNATAIAAGVIVDADVNASAAIVDTKLATISTAGKVSNSATTAASINTLSAIVARDPSGNFTAGTITAALTGAASSNVLKAGDTMTGALVVPAGTVTATGIQVGTGTTYKPGIYSPGTDQLAISTGGTGRLFVDASGQVGIGVAVPTVALDVAGSGNLASRIRLEKTGTGKIIQLGADRDTSAAPYIGSESNHDFSFITNNTERMRLRADGTFEIKGAGSAGVSPAVSVNPSAPANSAVMDSSGRLGLGTSGPTSALDVSYAGGTSGNDVLTLKLGADIGNLTSRTLNTRKFAVIGAANYSNASKNIGMMHLDSEASTSKLWLGGGASGIYDATEINFVTAATTTSTTGLQRMVITSGGNVGIGSTAPQGKLTISNSNAVGLEVTPYSTYNEFLSYNRSTSAYVPLNSFASSHVWSDSVGERARIDSSGRLLVGTASSTVHIRSGQKIASVATGGDYSGINSTTYAGASSAPAPIIDLNKSRGSTDSNMTSVISGDTLGYLQFRGADGTNFVTAAEISAAVGGDPGANVMPGRLVFSTNDGTANASPTERMRILSDGKVLVGHTSAVLSSKFLSQFAGNTENGAILNETANTASTTFLAFALSGTAIGSVTRVGATSAVVYNTTSDYRLKTIVGSVTGQGERIDALKPIDFQWKENGEQSRGFLAHEFQTVYANSVTGEKDAVDADGKPVYQAMQASTPEVIADLVAEIQQLRARVAALEAA